MIVERFYGFVECILKICAPKIKAKTSKNLILGYQSCVKYVIDDEVLRILKRGDLEINEYMLYRRIKAKLKLSAKDRLSAKNRSKHFDIGYSTAVSKFNDLLEYYAEIR